MTDGQFAKNKQNPNKTIRELLRSARYWSAKTIDTPDSKTILILRCDISGREGNNKSVTLRVAEEKMDVISNGERLLFLEHQNVRKIYDGLINARFNRVQEGSVEWSKVNELILSLHKQLSGGA